MHNIGSIYVSPGSCVESVLGINRCVLIDSRVYITL